MTIRVAKFPIGAIVRHRVYPFRGIVFDVDPTFSNTDEWWTSIPEDVRPTKDQPFYHLLAENEQTSYIAYVSEQNLLDDEDGGAVNHPQVSELFISLESGRYVPRNQITNGASREGCTAQARYDASNPTNRWVCTLPLHT